MWSWFFRYEGDRPDIGMIAGMYESLTDTIDNMKPQRVRLLT